MQTSKNEIHRKADFIVNFMLLCSKLSKLKKNKEELSILKTAKQSSANRAYNLNRNTQEFNIFVSTCA